MLASGIMRPRTAPCEVRCPFSEWVGFLLARHLIEMCGDPMISAVLASLRCAACSGEPGPVYLVAGQNRMYNHGPPPAWALELVLPRHCRPRRSAALDGTTERRETWSWEGGADGRAV